MHQNPLAGLLKPRLLGPPPEFLLQWVWDGASKLLTRSQVLLTIGNLGSVVTKFKRELGTCLAVQWLRLCTSTAGGMGSVPDRGAKIPHAAWGGQKHK